MFWENKSILITGGNGFLGKNLTMRLMELGAKKIKIADNLEKQGEDSYSLENKNIEFIKCDLRERKSSIDICDGIDIVFHCASKVGSNRYYIDSAFDVMSSNMIIDSNVLNAAIKSNISSYIYISSAFIYPLERMQDAFGKAILEEESFPANPVNSYGWAKLMGELSLKYATRNNNQLNGVVLRLSNFYGPFQSDDYNKGSIIPVLIRKAYEFSNNNSFSIFGNGSESRTYCYISDVLDALCISAEKSYEEHFIGPINIGSEIPIKIVDLAKKIIKISGKKINLRRIPSDSPKTMSQTLDCGLAKNILDGWTPRITLDTGLEKMYNHYLNKKI